jgi:DNA repair photolyase/very-short-patch-repair endonuclease
MKTLYVRGDFYVCPNPLSLDTYGMCEADCKFCLSGRTGIEMAHRPTKFIKDIVVGDNVRCYDLNNKTLAEGIVTNTFVRTTRSYLKIKIKIGKTTRNLVTTHEHPIYDIENNKWTEAKDVKIGTKVLWIKTLEASSEYMKIHNPMFKPLSIKKMVETNKNQGFYEWTAQNMKRLHREGKIPPHPMPEEIKTKFSERMKINNPMWNPDVSKKVTGTNRRNGLYDNGGQLGRLWKDENFATNTRIKIKNIMTTSNPMYNSDIAQKQGNTRSVRIKSGKISLRNTFASMRNRPTKPEKYLIELFQRYQIPYKYTGNGTKLINGRFPDFVHEHLRKIIEFDGPLHFIDEESINRTEDRNKQYQNAGYCVLCIETEELAEEFSLLEKILTFTADADPKIGTVTEIKEYKIHDGPFKKMYNIEVEGFNNYIANNILVHNCFIKSMEKTLLKNKVKAGLQPLDYYLLEKELSAIRSGKRSDIVSKFVNNDQPVIIGRKCEPFGKSEKNHKATFKCLRALKNYGIPAIPETKGWITSEYHELLKGVNLSVTPGSDEVYAKLEPDLPNGTDRINLAGTLTDIGIKVFIKAEPIIPYFYDFAELERFVRAVADVGATNLNFVSYRSHNLPIEYAKMKSVDVDYIQMYQSMKDWPTYANELFELCDTYGVRCVSPDWTLPQNKFESCCGYDGHFSCHHFTFQYAVKKIKESGSVSWEDMEKVCMFGERDREKFKEIWNGKAGYYNLKDYPTIKSCSKTRDGDYIYSTKDRLTEAFS